MGKMAARRNYKDSLFRMVFREKGELLSLYNAINGTDYDDPEELIVTTIEDVLYMGRKTSTMERAGSRTIRSCGFQNPL